MIAIADFSAGAMENWGLITYRETALLVDEKNSGLASKQRVAYVVAHELVMIDCCCVGFFSKKIIYRYAKLNFHLTILSKLDQLIKQN